MSTKLTVLQSTQDASVNFVTPTENGFFESRFVRRDEDYIICYLSSHDGCNRGCRMCHLTATGQTSMHSATLDDYHAQAEAVLNHYEKLTAREGRDRYVNFNFMARGEPLVNKTLLEEAPRLFTMLTKQAKRRDLLARFNISTIMPKTFKGDLVSLFYPFAPTIYYSFYSTFTQFREKWLPNAMPYDQALRLLSDYQAFTKKIVKVHHALIAGENDSEWDQNQVGTVCATRNLTVEFNLVRFNSPTSEYAEANEAAYERAAATLRSYGKVQIVRRVGFDVKASCGMFITGSDIPTGAS